MDKFMTLLIGLPAGIAITKYAQYIIDRLTGPWGWAENYLGGGGSYTACKLLGILVSLLSIMYATGALEVFLQSTIGTWGIF